MKKKKTENLYAEHCSAFFLCSFENEKQEFTVSLMKLPVNLLFEYSEKWELTRTNALFLRTV